MGRDWRAISAAECGINFNEYAWPVSSSRRQISINPRSCSANRPCWVSIASRAHRPRWPSVPRPLLFQRLALRRGRAGVTSLRQSSHYFVSAEWPGRCALWRSSGLWTIENRTEGKDGGASTSNRRRSQRPRPCDPRSPLTRLRGFVECEDRSKYGGGPERNGRTNSDGARQAAEAIPSSLQASLLARLDRLAPTRRIAQIGSALGREFSHRLLSRSALSFRPTASPASGPPTPTRNMGLRAQFGKGEPAAPASPSRGPGNGILRAETGGRIQAQNAGEQSEFGSQTTLRLTNPPELRGFLSTRKPPRLSQTELNRRPLQCHACFPSSIGSQPECVRTPGKRAPRSAPWPL